jgi:hypothetical protein
MAGFEVIIEDIALGDGFLAADGLDLGGIVHFITLVN